MISEKADVMYKCTDTYAPTCEKGILWSDPDIGIKWPAIESVIISGKDAKLPLLPEIQQVKLPE